jgi:membrane protease YdiL (CAAX protease family)
VVFGVTHGAMWAPGIAAGWLYGWLICSTGRMGESVAAHATTNGLLTGLVLLSEQWQFW